MFSLAEVQFVQRLAPHLAEGLRLGLLRQACESAEAAPGPGLIMLTGDGAVAGMNGAAGRWLEELGGRADGSELPVEISALAVMLRGLPAVEAAMPRLQVRTRSGRWAVLHASWLSSEADKTVTVILQDAAPAEIAPAIMTAYGLTDRERTISALVCQGRSTRQIADQLHLTVDTVQDHLKSVFDRTGVHSRGQLVAGSSTATTCLARWPVTYQVRPVHSRPAEPAGRRWSATVARHQIKDPRPRRTGQTRRGCRR